MGGIWRGDSLHGSLSAFVQLQQAQGIQEQTENLKLLHGDKACFTDSIYILNVQARLGAPLMNALQRLLAVLLSSAGGLDLLLHNAVAMGALLKALDPKADPYGPVFASDSQPSRQALSQQARRGHHEIVCDFQQGAHRSSWSRVL